MFALLLIFIFFRPFISSLAFPYLNLFYSALLLLFLASWLIYKKISITKLPALKLPLLLLFLSIAISVLFSINKAASLGELYQYLSGILIFIAAITLDDKDKMPAIHFMLLSAFIISILAIYQYFFGFRHLLQYLSRSGPCANFTLDYIQNMRVFFPFVTPNILGGYLAMIIPLALTEKKHNWLVIPLFLALLLTRSLGALIGLFFGLVVYFYIKTKTKNNKLVLMLALLIIILMIFLSRYMDAKQHLTPLFSTTMRLNYWLDTLKVISAYPFSGTGPGNFNLADARYAHNSYLQIWAELELLSLVSFTWLVISALKQALYKINDQANNKITICLISSASIFLIHNLVDFSLFLPEISLIWWIILGLTINIQNKRGIS